MLTVGWLIGSRSQQIVERSLSSEQASHARKHRKRKANWARGPTNKGKAKVTVEES